MIVTYLGTGAAEGIPALFCNCEYCRGVRERGGAELRTRAQVLLDGELSIDFPPDAFVHGSVRGVDLSAVRYLLVTHSHMDHFNAHDLILRGYKYAHNMTSERLEIYGNREIAEIFSECTRRELKEDVAARIGVHTVGAFEEIRFGGWTVHTLAARHSSEGPLLFSIEKGGKRVLHLCDTGILPEEDYAELERMGGAPCSLVTLDCTFLNEPHVAGARHMGIGDVAGVLRRLAAIGVIDKETKRVITHFSHNSAPMPHVLREIEQQYGVIAAYDGMRLEV